MYSVKLRSTRRARRKLRVRSKIYGSTVRPRFSIFRSNKYIYGQIIDDTTGKTVVAASLTDIKKIHESATKTEAATKLGELLAAKAIAQKISAVVFDRSGYRYHGRVKNLADGLRKGGLSL